MKEIIISLAVLATSLAILNKSHQKKPIIEEKKSIEKEYQHTQTSHYQHGYADIHFMQLVINLEKQGYKPEIKTTYQICYCCEDSRHESYELLGWIKPPADRVTKSEVIAKAEKQLKH